MNGSSYDEFGTWTAAAVQAASFSHIYPINQVAQERWMKDGGENPFANAAEMLYGCQNAMNCISSLSAQQNAHPDPSWTDRFHAKKYNVPMIYEDLT